MLRARRCWSAAIVAGFLLWQATVASPGWPGPSAQAYVEQAIALYNKGEYARAVDVLKKALALNPRYGRAHSWLGLCYVKLGRNQEAIAAFKQVIVLAPNSEDAKVARQWLARLQPAAGPPGATPTPVARPVPPQSAAPTGPTYLVDLLAATGVREVNRPREVQLFGQIYRRAMTETRNWRDNLEWRIVYNLQRRYARFKAVAGVVDGAAVDFNAKFEVRADGNTLHETRAKRAGDVPESLDLDVTGVLPLELVVRSTYRDYHNQMVVWADPLVDPRPSLAQAPTPPAAAPPAPAPVPPAAPPGTPRPPIPAPAISPAVPGPILSSRLLAIMPFADSSETGRGAGSRVATAIIEELFKLGQLETVGQQRPADAVGGARHDLLDVAFARQIVQKVGAGLMLLGVVERFQVQTSVSVTASFHVVDVATAERLLSETAPMGIRWSASQPGRLPDEETALREAARRMAAQIAQRVTFAWARQSGELAMRITQAVIARNVTRDADFKLQPVGPGTSFPASSLQIVAYISGTGAKPGQKVQFVWLGPEQAEYARETVTVPAEQQADQPFWVHHVIRPSADGNFPTGTWRVEVRLEGFLIRTLTFTVTEG